MSYYLSAPHKALLFKRAHRADKSKHAVIEHFVSGINYEEIPEKTHGSRRNIEANSKMTT